MLRNCACRGDAGWAHVACLAEFAASKVTEAQQNQDPVDTVSFWGSCILCKTPYMLNVALAMAEACVKQYEHLPDTNVLRFSSLCSLASTRYNVDDYDGAVEMCDRLLKICDVLTSEGIDVRRQEETIHIIMGGVFFKKQQFEDALLAFERQRDICVAVNGPNSPEVKENNKMLVIMKKQIGIEGYGHQEKGDTAAELVKARKNFREIQESVVISDKLLIHMRLVLALRNDGRPQESMELFEKLVAESRQTLGPDHPDTLRYENAANLYRQKVLQSNTSMASNSSAAGVTASEKKDVWAVIDCEQQPAISGQRVQVLRATKDAHKYVCLIKNDKGVSTKFKVAPNQFILETGTMVVVHGLVSSKDLNGRHGIISSFDKKKRRYVVNVEKKKTAVLIKPINLSVIFISGAYCHL